MYLEGCMQCDGLQLARPPIKLTTWIPKSQVALPTTYKPPAPPPAIAPKVTTIQPNRIRVGSQGTLVIVGSKFSKTSQIYDVSAGKTITTVFSSPTQLYSTGYKASSKPGNYLFYVKDSVSGLKSGNLQMVLYP